MISQTRLIVLLIFVLSLGVLGCSGTNGAGITPAFDSNENLATAETTGTDGRLVASEGTAIPLADVYVDGELTSFTDDEGAYSLELTPGDHTVSFGYEDIIFHETVINADSREVMQFPDPPRTGKLAGRVFGQKLDNDEETDPFEPLEGAIVLCIDKDHHWIGADVTNEEGKYLINKAPAGDSIVLAFARGYSPWSMPMFINPGTVQYKNIYLRRAPNLGHILGLVRDNEFNPLEDVHIVLTDPDDEEFERHARSLRFGAFLINRIPPGKVYVLHARKEGYENVDIPIWVHRGRNFIRFRMIPVNEEPPPGDG